MIPQNTEVVSIPASELCSRFLKPNKFLPFCKECENFSKKWSCPPFETENNFSEGIFKIFLTKVSTDSIRSSCNDANKMLKALTDSTRIGLDKYLLDIEKSTANSRAFFAGSCANCPIDVCPRITNKQCARPDFMRTSLEAHGFDICAIARELFGVELTWSAGNILPKSLHLVSAIYIK